jgi:hypothetical protein
MAGAVTSAFATFISLQIIIHYPFARNLLKLSLSNPLFAMQDGVHGRCGDLCLCLLHLFAKSFETVPLRSPFSSCRMVCMAGAVTSAFAIFISSKNLLSLSL